MLLDEMAEELIIMNKSKTSDNQGGYMTTWTEGASIRGVLVNDISMQARRAESENVTSTYTLTTTKANALEFHDVIKRVKDGRTFRITSNPSDKQSPRVASMDMAQATAEAWELTT